MSKYQEHCDLLFNDPVIYCLFQAIELNHHTGPQSGPVPGQGCTDIG